jgi:drug/metabolite transporter (DMT)-like permease
MAANKRHSTGIVAALASAIFLGVSPVFGKWAMLTGFSSLSVVAFRTGLAALLLLSIMAVAQRQYLYIFAVGLAGCFLAGAINGLGSLLYYLALGDLPASVGQLLYALYPVFVAFFSILDKQPLSRLTILRVFMAIVAVVLLTSVHETGVSIKAVMMMIGAAALYALHIPINQRVLYEIPAPTVTFYTLLSMSLITLPAYLLFDRTLPTEGTNWTPVILLTLVTFASRITLFLGIKNIGGTQTALLGLGELFITIALSYYFLNESLTSTQLVGAGILGITLLLASFEKPNTQRPKGGWLAWLHPPRIDPFSLQD